jgi:hypothetical protein
VSRLYNWNLLGPVLKPFGIQLSNDTKALVVAGGARMLPSQVSAPPFHSLLQFLLFCDTSHPPAHLVIFSTWSFSLRPTLSFHNPAFDDFMYLVLY